MSSLCREAFVEADPHRLCGAGSVEKRTRKRARESESESESEGEGEGEGEGESERASESEWESVSVSVSESEREGAPEELATNTLRARCQYLKRRLLTPQGLLPDT